MLVKVNLIPRLKNILDGCYDPKGGYVPSDEKRGENEAPKLVKKPWGKDHQPTGYISLSAADYECFRLLCQKVRYDYDKEAIKEIGAGGAEVLIRDLAGAMAKATPELEVPVDVQMEG